MRSFAFVVTGENQSGTIIYHLTENTLDKFWILSFKLKCSVIDKVVDKMMLKNCPGKIVNRRGK